MPYSTRRVGKDYQVIVTDTEEVKGTHKPPNAKKKAEAQCRALEESEGFNNPDKVSYLSDGTRVNIKYKNKEKYSGTNA